MCVCVCVCVSMPSWKMEDAFLINIVINLIMHTWLLSHVPFFSLVLYSVSLHQKCSALNLLFFFRHTNFIKVNASIALFGTWSGEHSELKFY